MHNIKPSYNVKTLYDGLTKSFDWYKNNSDKVNKNPF